MDPVVALHRIGYLLERSRESTRRVEAFRKAARALEALGPAEVAHRVATGTLRELPGIGDSTGTVIEQAQGGAMPDYLVRLEAAATIPLASGGEAIRAALRGDLHTHTDWSDGGSPLPEMIAAALTIGHEYVAITDHSPRLTVANGLSADRLRRQLELIAAVNDHLDGMRVLSGIECDINEDGTLDQTDELLGRVDVVVASVHSKLRSDRATMTKRMLAAIENPHADVLGHCTGRLITGGRGTRPPSEFDAAAVFAACAATGTAVEINSRPERLDPPRALLRQAVRAGCLFSIDTDSHAPGQLEFQVYGCARAAECDVPIERIVNTWPLADLLAWTTTRAVPA